MVVDFTFAVLTVVPGASKSRFVLALRSQLGRLVSWMPNYDSSVFHLIRMELLPSVEIRFALFDVVRQP